MTKQVPLVSYLVLDDGEPYLVARSCVNCAAVWLDRRNACGKCGQDKFEERRLSNDATLRAFTIVHRAAPRIPTPFISAIVDLEGGGVVKSNLVGVEPDPDNIKLGMPLRLTTYVVGTDDEGTEAIAFGYMPA